MDAQTVAYYQDNAWERAAIYRAGNTSVLDGWAAEFLPTPASALEVGFGSGRDLDRLRSLGHQVHGVDASSTMLTEAIKHYPALQGHLAVDALPTLASLGDAQFGGVIAFAVVMHLPKEDLAAGMERLKSLATIDGHLGVSFPITPRGVWGSDRDASGRLFRAISGEDLRDLMAPHGVQLVQDIEIGDGLGRAEERWRLMTWTRLT